MRGFSRAVPDQRQHAAGLPRIEDVIKRSERILHQAVWRALPTLLISVGRDQLKDLTDKCSIQKEHALSKCSGPVLKGLGATCRS